MVLYTHFPGGKSTDALANYPWGTAWPDAPWNQDEAGPRSSFSAIAAIPIVVIVAGCPTASVIVVLLSRHVAVVPIVIFVVQSAPIAAPTTSATLGG